MTKRLLFICSLLIFSLLFFTFIYFNGQKKELISPFEEEIAVPTPKPLAKYSFANLKNRHFEGSQIVLEEELAGNPDFTSYLFFFSSDEKRVSGLANIPKIQGNLPVIVMFRGYVDREVYQTGIGTKRTGEAFADAGFITLAPDFLGYGYSASPSAFPLEERFETYTTAANLLASVETLNRVLEKEGLTNIKADTEKVSLWGHSNGGQIALSILEITGGHYPTVLWSPVSKPFPYSILYYTDEFEDKGKMLRSVLAEFEADYDVEQYNPTNYFDLISAPIQLHQGSADDAVPEKWSDLLSLELKELGKDVAYYTYPGEDHNFNSGSWSLAVSRSIEFYKSKLLSAPGRN